MFNRDEEYEQRIAQLERELAEARATIEGLDAYAQKYHEQTKAAEACLAAVAEKLDHVSFGAAQCEPGIAQGMRSTVEIIRAALTAPTEPRATCPCGDNVRSLRAQLAAAAPLFEAAHAMRAAGIATTGERQESVLDAAADWASSPEGQAWLAAHRAERSGG